MNSVLLDLSNSFAGAVERAGRSIVTVNEGGRAGVSGTVWRDNLVVTAEHTIRAQQELRKLRGTFKFSINLDGLREDREWSRSIPRR